MTNDILIDEQDLRDALRPVRPDRNRFDEAVAQKVREREQQSALFEGSPFLRQAAALLPPGIAPLMPVAAVGKKLGVQVAASFFAMPVLVLAMTALTFVAGLRSLRKLDAGELSGGPSLENAKLWWRAHPVGVLVAVLLFLGLGFTRSIDLLLGLVIVSMLVLTWVLSKLSSAGLAGRAQVGLPCGYLLIMLTMGVSPVRDLVGMQQAQLQGLLIYVLLFGGGVACLFFAIPVGGDRRTGMSRLAALLMFVPLLGIVLFMQLFAWQRSRTVVGMTRPELVEYVEVTAPALDKSPTWRTLCEAATWLRSQGEDPDLTPARTAFREALASGADVSNFVLGYGADLGWIEDEDWEAILDERRVKRLLEGTGEVHFVRQARYLLQGVVATGALTQARRDQLAQRLLATWEPEDLYAQLGTLAEIKHGLELIERGDRLTAETVHDALRTAWIYPEVERHGGGFALFYRRGKEHASAQAVGEAVALMERFGVPEGIDPVAVRDYLTRAATRSRRVELSVIDVDESLALLRFEQRFAGSLPVDPGPTPGQRILDWRLTIGVALLVGLCLVTTLRAPVEQG